MNAVNDKKHRPFLCFSRYTHNITTSLYYRYHVGKKFPQIGKHSKGYHFLAFTASINRSKPCLHRVSSFILGNRVKKRSAGNRPWLNSLWGSLCLFRCFLHERLTSIYTKINTDGILFDGRGCPWT